MPTQEKIVHDPNAPVDPRVEMLVNELIGRVADKWTLLVLEELEDHGVLRFTELARRVPGISQKMLTQTLRAMERDGLVERTVHPVIPPKVEYRLTDLGHSLGEAFCGVWHWAGDNLDRVEAARKAFDDRE
ncbi:winged helix-turn-helix transcriptional regulator [Sphingopyxis sp.]|uniref:winged helix-turn-helix transcriptional regulator n=1 Tax=Sphingopyxis sp. TaxID=1908224 RepID=UPI0035B1C08C